MNKCPNYTLFFLQERCKYIGSYYYLLSYIYSPVVASYPFIYNDFLYLSPTTGNIIILTCVKMATRHLFQEVLDCYKQ